MKCPCNSQEGSFEAYSEFDEALDGELADLETELEEEEEIGRSPRRPVRSFAPRRPPRRPRPFGKPLRGTARPRIPRKKPWPPRSPTWPFVWPPAIYVYPPKAPPSPPDESAADGVAVTPEPASAAPGGGEYVRWVQDALNRALGLRLPVNGIMDAATRSAVRSFQERQGLPITGLVGPETERALITAVSGQSPGAGVTKPAGSGMTEPAEPAATPSAAEFDFEWKMRAPLRRQPGGVNDGFQAQLLDMDFNEALEDGTSMSESNLFEVPKPKVSKRNRQGYIKWVQTSLNKVLGLKLVTDGRMGTQTRSAIRNFQKKVGLKADGIVERKTEQALIKANLPLTLSVSKLKSVRIASHKPKKVNAKRLIPTSAMLREVGKAGKVGIEIDPVNAITTIFNNEGDIEWGLDQMKEAKYPWNQEKWGAGIWTSNSVDFYQGMDTVLGDEISAKFRINYKYNGHSVGYFVIDNINTEDAAFWGLKVTAKISPDPNAYDIDGKRPVAAVEVYWNYKFDHFYWGDKIYSGKIKFYGNGHFETSGNWTQW